MRASALDQACLEPAFAPQDSTVLNTAATVCSDLHTTRSILFLVDQLCELGGGERALFDLARALKRRGFRVSVVTFKDQPDPAVFSLFDDITLMPLTSCFNLGAVRVAGQLRRLIRQRQVHIVQTYFESADLFGAVVARLSGVPCVLSSRRDMGILRSAKHRLAYRAVGRLYNGVLTVSDQVRAAHMRADRLSGARVHTIHNGITLARFDQAADRAAIRQRFGLSPDAPLITTVTNINPWKGVDVFLRAAALVHRKHPTAAFAIAGAPTDRDLTASLQRQAEDLGIAHRTFFLGQVADVPGLLLSSDVFALLSRSEGLPNVVLEAMAARLPVVATAVGGTPEVVDHASTGFLVNNEDADDAAHRIHQLLSDPLLLRRMGSAARARVEQEFSLSEMVRKHVELYDRLLPNRLPRSA